MVQEPASPGEKGVDIRGEYLELNHFIDGNKLKVVGDHAQVQLNQICIVGPEVSINQATNEAWVNGTGVMRMPSKNNFDGTPLAREAELVINWEKSMYFDGRTAVFRGGVRATQDQGHLATDAMTVTMDHKVSLREGDKTNPPAKVQQLVCERKVWVEDSTIRDRRLISYKRIQGLELWADVDNEKNDSIVEVAGPGVVRIFQLGSKGEMFPAPGAAGNQASPAGASQDRKQRPSRTEEEFKLTLVLFQEKMQANNKQGIANFFGGVVVFHVPTQDKDLRINELAPPPECMRLSCRQLKVLSLKMADGTMQQEMTASGRVSIIGQNFEGSADVAKHDESKGQLILEGTESNRAVLVKQQGKGTERQTFRARKIMYWPKTGEVKADDATMLNGVK